ncbi:MAG: hypothetical protein AB9903_32860 [Vulcanimicrobiota bacterium]
MAFLDKIKDKIGNTMDEVRLNIRYGRLSVERRSILSEIGMLFIKKGKNMGFSDPEIDDLVKKITMLSAEIKDVGKQIKVQEDFDFTQIRGENPMTEKFNRLMMRITTTSEKYELRNKYDGLVDKGMDTLSQLGYFVMSVKNKNFEVLKEYLDARKRYDRINEDYLRMGREIKAVQVLSRERSEFLIPFLTFLFSMKDFSRKQHSKNLK